MIPLVADVHVILKRIQCEKTVWSKKRSQERLSVIFQLDKGIKNAALVYRPYEMMKKNYKPHLTIE